MREQIQSRLISPRVFNTLTGETVQEELIRDFTINLDDIHSIGDATGCFLFECKEPIIAVSYYNMNGGTLYYIDSFERIYKLWSEYREQQDKNKIQTKFN